MLVTSIYYYALVVGSRVEGNRGDSLGCLSMSISFELDGLRILKVMWLDMQELWLSLLVMVYQNGMGWNGGLNGALKKGMLGCR